VRVAILTMNENEHAVVQEWLDSGDLGLVETHSRQGAPVALKTEGGIWSYESPGSPCDLRVQHIPV
jgi:hypothetical protein